MRSTLIIALRYTIVTTILLGIVYPLVITGLAQLTMRDKANGQLITRDGQVIGSGGGMGTDCGCPARQLTGAEPSGL